jgi:hypothetical protein
MGVASVLGPILNLKEEGGGRKMNTMIYLGIIAYLLIGLGLATVFVIYDPPKVFSCLVLLGILYVVGRLHEYLA